MNNWFAFKILVTLFLWITLSNELLSQSIPFEKNSFENDKEGFKLANNKLKEGEAYFEEEFYEQAIEPFLLAQNFNPNNAILNYKIGFCYLNSESRYKCLEYFKKSFELDREISTDIHYMIAQGFQLNHDFKMAINEYKAYLSTISSDPKNKELVIIERYINQCYNGIQYMNEKPTATVENMGITINSNYNDHSPLITVDESLLVFTSTRENNKKAAIDGQFDEDIFISNSKDNQWQFPESIGEPINNPYNNASVGLSPDGQQMLIYNGDRGNGDIEICYFEGKSWTSPKTVSDEINTDFRETSACFSPDGNHIYFVSDRPGGLGESDIYVSKKNNKGKWDKPKNIGSEINSEFSEETVFMHPDGRTLFFSSQGHRTMGGFDIFKSQQNDLGVWEEPVNLGFPVNSADDDLCFVLSANGRHGYCSSIRSDSYGGYDIYKITFNGAEKPILLSNHDAMLAVKPNSMTKNAVE
jgi:Tol biopolymer transport system component